ncbi:MAG: hypothetical protein GC165_18050 [Armatimonadetes bacterium]|nr:hypothetical protein [Armatimonadota bacterium]
MTRPDLVSLLRHLVDKVCQPYIDLPNTQAVLSIGSVSYEIVDEYSDVDIAIYYDKLPSNRQLAEAMRKNGADQLNWCLGDRNEGSLIESYDVFGVECQFAHTTIDAMDKHMNSVLVDLDVTSPFQKALSGVLAGRAIHGQYLIDHFKARASKYPDALQVAMVDKYFTIQPWWAIEARLAVRDAELWRAQALVEGAQNLIGTLAGVNRLYFSTFQFKRMSDFLSQMQEKPANLADRLTLVFEGGQGAAAELRDLTAETLAIVERVVPTANTASVRRALARKEKRWSADELSKHL